MLNIFINIIKIKQVFLEEDSKTKNMLMYLTGSFGATIPYILDKCKSSKDQSSSIPKYSACFTGCFVGQLFTEGMIYFSN